MPYLIETQKMCHRLSFSKWKIKWMATWVGRAALWHSWQGSGQLSWYPSLDCYLALEIHSCCLNPYEVKQYAIFRVSKKQPTIYKSSTNQVSSLVWFSRKVWWETPSLCGGCSHLVPHQPWRTHLLAGFCCRVPEKENRSLPVTYI